MEYRNKYLKYKTKYLNLQQIGGDQKFIIFDSMGTLFSMDNVNEKLQMYLKTTNAHMETALQSSIIRDALTQSYTGSPFADFKTIAAANIRYLFIEKNIEAKDEQINDIIAEFKKLKLKPGFIDELQNLKKSGYKLIILTNSNQETMEELIRFNNMSTIFTINDIMTIDEKEIQKWKPFAKPYQVAINRLGQDANKIMFVSSHPWDIQGASANGLKTVFLKPKYKSDYPNFFQNLITS